MTIEQLVEQAQHGDVAALTELCEKFAGLMKKAAGRSYLRLIYDEVLSAAYLSFIEVVKTYQIDRQIPFAGYAQSKVNFAIWNLFKSERYRWQREITLETEKSSGITIGDDLADPADIVQQTENQLLVERIFSLMDKLPTKQRQVIVYNLIIGDSLTHIAAKLQSTPQAIYGLKKRALARLKMAIV